MKKSHIWALIAAIGWLALLAGCQDKKAVAPPDYSSFYEVESRQWVTKVEGIKPDAIAQIRETVEGVQGVVKGSVLVGLDYVAFRTAAGPEERLEHTRIGADVSAALKQKKGLRVGDSTTGPQP
jgi:hypothetical protein